MKTFADYVIAFNRSLRFNGHLPEGIGIMNPFRDHPEVMKVSSEFYRKYYDDHEKRYFILGINPGRFGAGLTGVPFTDPKRLKDVCGISYSGRSAHEPSSVFIYDMIERSGGVKKFYSKFYINSICPLGFVKYKNGKEVNYNYYDQPDLLAATEPFIHTCIQKQLGFGIYRDVCFCLGTGKNYRFLARINDENKYFEKIIPLEHPRYIIQYKSKEMKKYLDKFTNVFSKVT